VNLIYSGPAPMVLPSICGRSPYSLGHSGQVLGVDPRDVDALIKTGWFALR
jgi:hypothetical protein